MDISTENKTSEIKFYKFNDNTNATQDSSEPTDKKNDNLNSNDNLNDNLNDKKIELNLEDIFVNLTLISKIEIGNKLFQKDKYINIDNSYFAFISRWFYGNNRKSSINFITQILNKAFEYCSELVSVNTPETSQQSLRLNNDLKNAINGLTNLKLTYSYDKLIQAEIDVMIDNIRSKLDLYFKNVTYSPIITSQTSSRNLVSIDLNEAPRHILNFQEKRENKETINKKERRHFPVPYDDNISH